MKINFGLYPESQLMLENNITGIYHFKQRMFELGIEKDNIVILLVEAKSKGSDNLIRLILPGLDCKRLREQDPNAVITGFVRQGYLPRRIRNYPLKTLVSKNRIPVLILHDGRLALTLI